eukprot:UN09532
MMTEHFWKCAKCNLLNYPNKANCIGCFHKRNVSTSWKCTGCNLSNNADNKQCIACFKQYKQSTFTIDTRSTSYIKKKCIFRFFASDAMLYGDNSNYNILRISPYSSPMVYFYCTDNADTEYQADYKHFDYKNIILMEKQTGIYYIEFDANHSNTKYQRAYFQTSPWKWPKSSYTMLIWIKWNISGYTLTTFDSEDNAPLIAEGAEYDVLSFNAFQIGCASEY